MNIKEAKEEIRNAVAAYLTKNEFGCYKIPIHKQRPLFLMGPPGVGKTAIMEQVASEMGIGLVSYSMTHHTRQSALGLPFIEAKTYDGRQYSVSEYTMSEIIASVYDMMESTGIKEGILFLDEINCVSETLAPSMLQFLQYKIFGRHRVPDGWIVVTAGNPPEYNNSVREFDIVTWDRLKRIDIEPDFEAWKEYASNSGIHPAILTYLEIKNTEFYRIETTVDGKQFVTARGWSDLSDMIKLYEEHQFPVTQKLVAQYLQNPHIAKRFAIYYDMFNKYRSDYQIDDILNGKATEAVESRARNARFDERLSLIGLLLDGIYSKLRHVVLSEQVLVEVMNAYKSLRVDMMKPHGIPADAVKKSVQVIQEKLNQGIRASTLSEDKIYSMRKAIAMLEKEEDVLIREQPASGAEAFLLLKKDYDAETKLLKQQVTEAGRTMSNMFAFCEKVFGEGQELLIIITEMSLNCYSTRFISKNGCKEYFAHNKELLFYERQKEIISELDGLDLE